MSWVKLDDQLPRNMKIIDAGSAEAAWYYVCTLAHCAAALTDGFLDRRAIHMVAPHVADPAAAIDACVQAGLMDEVEGGWEIPDYTEFNPTRAKVLADREAGKVRAAKSRARRTPGATQETHGEGAAHVRPNVHGTFGVSSGDPSRPLLLPTSRVTTGGDPHPVDSPVDDRVAHVIDLLADHERSTVKGPVESEPRWRMAVVARLRREHQARIVELLDGHRDDVPLTAIAGAVRGESPSTLHHYRITNPTQEVTPCPS